MNVISKPRIYDRLDVKFMIIIGVFLAILLASIFWYMSNQTQERIISELYTEATKEIKQGI